MWWGGLASLASAGGAGAAQASGRDGASAKDREGAGQPDGAAVAESLLDALAPASAQPGAGQADAEQPKGSAKRSSWVVAAERPLTESSKGLLTPEQLLGHWVDSQGNAVHVLSTDAYDVRLVAILSRPPRPDIHLSVKPVILGGGWQCGHSLLDPMWTSLTQLHWVTMQGRVSVWVRPQEESGQQEQQPEGSGQEGKQQALGAQEEGRAAQKDGQQEAEGGGDGGGGSEGAQPQAGDSGGQ